MVVNPGMVLGLSPGLAVLYVLVVIVWYQLLCWLVLDLVRRRRRNQDPASTSTEETRALIEPRTSERDGSEPVAAGELELERARRHFYLARQTAKAERDAAIATATAAAEEAIGRIERRYREIDEGFIDQETQRISQMLGRHSNGNGEHPR